MIAILLRLWRYFTGPAGGPPYCGSGCPKRRPDGSMCDECAAWWGTR
jgi:hypothetical protein